MVPEHAAPDDWTMGGVVRELQRLAKLIESEQTHRRAEAERFVPREVWDAQWDGLAEWRTERARDIVDMQAEQARMRKEWHEWQRAETAARTQALAAEAAARSATVSALAADIRTGLRWGVGLAIPALLTVAGLVWQAV